MDVGFESDELGSYCRILSREVACFDLTFEEITLAALLRINSWGSWVEAEK